ncbi:permease prefix domain 1-containing protein [Streptomyces sp. NPDC003006]
MSATGRLIQEYAAELTAALHGPAKAKARLVDEVRDGLADTAAAYADAGLPEEEAARQAVREFGTVDELLASCQRELTVVQARHTARAVTLTAPFLVGCWYLARTAGHDLAWQLPRTAQLVAVHLAFVATVAAVLAAVTLAATGSLARRLPTPDRVPLPLVVAWAGTTASGAMAASALALATAAALATDWPLLASAGALAAASHATIASSARACRHCARLPTAKPTVRPAAG